MDRLKTYVADGSVPNGRLYVGDMNALQDAVAAIDNLTQTIALAVLEIGATDLQILRYGAGVTQTSEARLTGDMRVDGILRGLSGLIAGAFTTTARNAIASGHAPYGIVILNTTTNRYEYNAGTDGSRNWLPLAGSVPQEIRGVVNADGTIPSGWTGFTVVHNSAGSYDIAFSTAFAAAPIVVAEQYGGNVNIGVPTINGFHADTQGVSDAKFNFIAKGQ